MGTPPPPTDGPLTAEELQLATRNKGMPLEALRYDTTPVGLHYTLIHFDIPAIDPDAWRLRIGGSVARPVELDLAAIRARPARTLTVTLECAGNGRARLLPRPVSMPWLVEAVGTATWTGTPLAAILAEVGLAPETVELVFTGADHGIEKGDEHDYARSLTVADATRPEVLLAYEMNGRPLEPQHGFPLRLLVPGWYGMTHVKWLARIDAVTTPFAGYQQRVAYFYKRDAEDPGVEVQRIRPRALMIPPGFPDFLTRRRIVERGPVVVTGRAWSGHGAITRVELGCDGAWRDARAAGRRARVARLVGDVGRDARRARARLPRHRRERAGAADRRTVELPGHGQQPHPARPGHGPLASHAGGCAHPRPAHVSWSGVRSARCVLRLVPWDRSIRNS